EAHPLQDARPLQSTARKEGRAIGQVVEDRVRFEEKVARLGLEHRDTAVRILVEELRGASLTVQDVLLDQSEGDAELGEEQADLVAVARREIVVETEHGARLARAPVGRKAALSTH